MGGGGARLGLGWGVRLLGWGKTDVGVGVRLVRGRDKAGLGVGAKVEIG